MNPREKLLEAIKGITESFEPPFNGRIFAPQYTGLSLLILLEALKDYLEWPDMSMLERMSAPGTHPADPYTKMIDKEYVKQYGESESPTF